MTNKGIKYSIGFVIIFLLLAGVGFNFCQRHTGAVLGTFNIRSTSSLELIFFDVGQGDASLIITPGGEDILVDGGPDNKVLYGLGQYLPPTDRTIETVILSHPHSDHVAGLVEVLKRYQVNKVIMTGVTHTAPDYLEFLRLVEEKDIPVEIIEQPQEETIDGLVLKFLAPEKNWQGEHADNLNNTSIVFKLVYGSTTALYTGDFENEEGLLLQSMVQIKSDVLKVGHHGSTNANDKGFLSAAAPELAIVSVGADNQYGHPHYRTLYYLKRLGAKIFRTDLAGDIRLFSDGREFMFAD
ncbi:MAG: MBL fold metallo-hydrolase [Patescibacteria group bacterium]|jgi:beta-lactamase superfamily II metal-dependent hydrolase